MQKNKKKAKKKAMMKELNLTKDQQGQLKEYNRSMKQKREDIRHDQTLTDTQKKSKLKELKRREKRKNECNFNS